MSGPQRCGYDPERPSWCSYLPENIKKIVLLCQDLRDVAMTLRGHHGAVICLKT